MHGWKLSPHIIARGSLHTKAAPNAMNARDRRKKRPLIETAMPHLVYTRGQQVARGEFIREPAPLFSALMCTCCVAGEQLVRPPRTTCWSRFNRQGDHQRPGAAAPCCTRSTPAWPAASSRRSWSPPPPPPPSSCWIAHVAPGVCQPGPTIPPPACRRVLWKRLGRVHE